MLLLSAGERLTSVSIERGLTVFREAAVIRKLEFPPRLAHAVVPTRPGTEGLSSSPPEPLPWAACLSSRHGSQLAPELVIRGREQERERKSQRLL